MADNTQTQQQINALRTLQESYDALADAQSAQATATALEAAKQAILTAIGGIDIDTSDLAKQGANPNTSLTVVDNKIGTAPVGSDKATLFAWLTTIYEYLAGQTPEEIPESLGDRINFLLQFFGLPQALPEYQSMTVAEVTDYLEEIMQNIDPDLTAEDAAAITEEVLSSDSSDDSSD